MARNQEKARSTLSRWLAQQKEESGFQPKQKRPHLASLVDNLKDAEKWRRQILKEVSTEVTLIQNEALDEFKVKDMNDHINKLLREKHHWEKRIIELGGPNYIKQGVPIGGDDCIVGPGGYVYFGAAKHLPGVQELLQHTARGSSKKERKDLYKLVDAEYFGFGDDDDNQLAQDEAFSEELAIEESLNEWRQIQSSNGLDPDTILKLMVSQGTDVSNSSTFNMEEKFEAYISIPTREEIEKMMMERRKQELLSAYLNDES